MAPMSASEASSYSRADRETLLHTARQSIAYGLDHGHPLPVDPAKYPQALQALRATFITLNKNGQLRGCIGTLTARQALIKDVADNAFAAAFRDPRFPPLERSEEDALELHISILSPAEPMTFTDEADLLRQIRPGVDGLILEAGLQRGTFLPSVWESLPTAEAFLQHLKHKAGLPADYWSDTIRVSRYTAEYI